MEKIELKEFVRKAIVDIEDGIEIGKRRLDGPIKFEVSVIKTEKLGGNLKIFVASGGRGIEKESVAKISFEVKPYYPNTGKDVYIPVEKRRFASFGNGIW